MTHSSLTARLQWHLAALLLACALVLGGGQGTLGDTWCQVLALALVACCLWRNASEPSARLPRAAWLAGLALLLPALQLLPIPEGLWQSSSAREHLASQLASVGLAHTPTLSLDPVSTQRAMLWMLPAVALYLAGLQFRGDQRFRLVAVFVGIALLGMLLGISQLAGGVGSPLHFYEVTNYGKSVGFFANSNHYAIQMAMALPLVLVGTAAWVNHLGAAGDHVASRAPLLWWLLGGGIAIALMLGIALARSRAGIGLGVLGVLLSVPATLALRNGRGTVRVMVVGAVLAAALIVQFALFGIVQRIEQGVGDDARLQYASLTLELAADYAPLGTGLGGFRRAFEGFDREAPVEGVYVNHAHNDAAELWLEAGWALPVVALPLLLVFAWAGWKVWRGGGGTSPASTGLRRAAWISLLLVLLHCLVDYPLRTTAHLALLGLLASMLVAGPRKRTSTTASDAAQPDLAHAA
jgi:O-antigen ligase